MRFNLYIYTNTIDGYDTYTDEDVLDHSSW